MNIRAIISTALLITFIVVTITGIGLYLAPHGRHSSLWTFMGIPKYKLEQYHTISGFIMVGLIILHLYINRKMYIGELKQLTK